MLLRCFINFIVYTLFSGSRLAGVDYLHSHTLYLLALLLLQQVRKSKSVFFPLPIVAFLAISIRNSNEYIYHLSAYDSTTQMPFSCVLTEPLQPLSPSLYLHLVTFDLATLEQAARGTACERTGARKSSLPETHVFFTSHYEHLERCLRSISAATHAHARERKFTIMPKCTHGS